MATTTRRAPPKKEKKSLDIRDEFLKVRERYAEDSRTRAFNALIYGRPGTGKTFSLRSAVKPVLIHSFDPGGSLCLRQWIDKGEILVDSRFEKEDAKSPSSYEEWEQEFNRLRTSSFFDHIGTYVIDSVTTWSESLMNSILKKRGHLDEVPQIKEYLIQMFTIRDVMKICTGLPCNFIAIAHLDFIKDEESGRAVTGPMVTGKMSEKLPLLFDEVYVALAKEKPSGIEYSFLTENSGYYLARSRLSEGTKLKRYEEPDIRAILHKTGFPVQDKPLIT